MRVTLMMTRFFFFIFGCCFAHGRGMYRGGVKEGANNAHLAHRRWSAVKESALRPLCPACSTCLVYLYLVRPKKNYFQRMSAVSSAMFSETETPLHSRRKVCVTLSYVHGCSGVPGDCFSSGYHSSGTHAGRRGCPATVWLGEA